MKQSESAFMNLLDSGISNHRIIDIAGDHTGEEEQKESNNFSDFLISKNGCLVMKLEQIYCG